MDFAGVEENSTWIDTVVMVHVQGSELNDHLQFHILNPTDMFEIGVTSALYRSKTFHSIGRGRTTIYSLSR